MGLNNLADMFRIPLFLLFFLPFLLFLDLFLLLFLLLGVLGVLGVLGLLIACRGLLGGRIVDGLPYHHDPLLHERPVLARELCGVPGLERDHERRARLVELDGGVCEVEDLLGGLEGLGADRVVVDEEGRDERDERAVRRVEHAARLREDACDGGVAQRVEVRDVLGVDELLEEVGRRDGGRPRDLVEVRLQQARALLDDGGVRPALEDVPAGELGEPLVGELDPEVQVQEVELVEAPRHLPQRGRHPLRHLDDVHNNHPQRGTVHAELVALEVEHVRTPPVALAPVLAFPVDPTLTANAVAPINVVNTIVDIIVIAVIVVVVAVVVIANNAVVNGTVHTVCNYAILVDSVFVYNVVC